MQARKLKFKDGQQLPKATPLGGGKARLGPRSSRSLLVALHPGTSTQPRASFCCGKPLVWILTSQKDLTSSPPFKCVL